MVTEIKWGEGLKEVELMGTMSRNGGSMFLRNAGIHV
jgi:hypothetical protein